MRAWERNLNWPMRGWKRPPHLWTVKLLAWETEQSRSTIREFLQKELGVEPTRVELDEPGKFMNSYPSRAALAYLYSDLLCNELGVQKTLARELGKRFWTGPRFTETECLVPTRKRGRDWWEHREAPPQGKNYSRHILLRYHELRLIDHYGLGPKPSISNSRPVRWPSNTDAYGRVKRPRYDEYE